MFYKYDNLETSIFIQKFFTTFLYTFLHNISYIIIDDQLYTSIFLLGFFRIYFDYYRKICNVFYKNTIFIYTFYIQLLIKTILQQFCILSIFIVLLPLIKLIYLETNLIISLKQR